MKKIIVLIVMVATFTFSLFSQDIVNDIRQEFFNFDATLGQSYSTLVQGYGFDLSEYKDDSEWKWLSSNMHINGIPKEEYIGYNVFLVNSVGGLRYAAGDRCWILFKNNIAEKIIYNTTYKPTQLARILQNVFYVEIGSANNNAIIINKSMFIFKNISTIKIIKKNLRQVEFSLLIVYNK